MNPRQIFCTDPAHGGINQSRNCTLIAGYEVLISLFETPLFVCTGIAKDESIKCRSSGLQTDAEKKTDQTPPSTLRSKSLETAVGTDLSKEHVFSLKSNHLRGAVCVFQGPTSPFS